jgi:chromosome partitioning protein
MRQAKVITVAQQKGGSGKTTVAAHLAVAFYLKKKKVAVIDIDPQGSLKSWYGIREQMLEQEDVGVSMIAVPGWQLYSEISRIKDDFDIIIIDSPPHMETESKNAIRVSDLVLIPMQPSPTDIWATTPIIDLIKREEKSYAILLNRVPHNSRIAKEICAEFDQNILKHTLGNRVSFAASLITGRTANEVEPSGLAAEEVNAVVKELTSVMANKTKVSC